MSQARDVASEELPLQPSTPESRQNKLWFGKINHNVALAMLAKSGDGLSTGLWNGAVMATWLFVVENNSNKAVGIAEGFFGIFCVAGGLPAGWLADRMRRDRLLRIFGCIMYGAIVMTALAVILPSKTLHIFGHDIHSQYLIILVAMVLWGVAEGYGPASDAIFADSIPTGQRDGIYTIAFTLYVVANSLGQFIAAGLLYFWGNDWTVNALGSVILVGMGTSLVSSSALFFFDDDCTLGDESEAINHSASVADLEAVSLGGEKLEYGWTSINFILPAALLFSQAGFGLAAGMTVKFFPVYFKTAVHLNPAATNSVLAATPLFLAPFSFLARYAGRQIGRVRTIFLFEIVGVGSMLYMGRFPSCWTNLAVIIPLYILRSTANNSVYALQSSITMDYIPKGSRGKWNSLDSLMIAGWSASAVLGGFLLDHHGFGTTFTITAVLQVAFPLMYEQGMAVSILIPLSFLGDPAAEMHKTMPAVLEAAETAAAAVAEDTGGLSALLLPIERPRRTSRDGGDGQRQSWAADALSPSAARAYARSTSFGA